MTEHVTIRPMSTPLEHGLGWTPDHPDIRDYTIDSLRISEVLKDTVVKAAVLAPAKIDLTPGFQPIENQGSLGSCTAQAGIGLLEYYERRALGRHIDASRLFLYKVTRKLLGWTGDTGAYLRTTMKALALLGAPPEEHYPYIIANFDQEPSAFVYSLAQNWQALSYYRLDPAGASGLTALAALKNSLAANQPSMFGFTVYGNAINAAARSGIISFPKAGDRVVGGHAVIAVGYDDSLVVDGIAGAIKIRNSWGTGWGQAGYGWLPYGYFTSRLAQDIWSLVRSEYVDLAPFV